jgi:hypothetical protein
MPSPVQAFASQNNPQVTLDWLRRLTQTGQSITPPGMPGSFAMGSAGLLPTNPGYTGG